MISDHAVNDGSRWTYSGTATAEAAGTLRRRLYAWLEQRGLTAITNDVALAAYEAMANSVEHAYTGVSGVGPLTITAVHDASMVTVTVSDAGEWHPPTASAYRGRGLDLASKVTDRFDVEHDGVGTTVTLGWDASPVETDRTPPRA